MPTLVISALVCVPTTWAILLLIVVQPFTSVRAAMAGPETAAGHRSAAVWAASFVVYMAAAVWNLVVARIIVQRYVARGGRWVLLGVAVACATVGFFVRRSYANDAAPLSLVVERGVPIYHVTALGNSLTAALIILMIASCGALSSHRPQEVLSTRNLRRRIALAKLSLYSAAALLIVGVIQIYFLNDWPAHIFAGGASDVTRSGLHDLAYTAAIVSGAFYSAILLLMYAPVLITHDKWVSKLAEQAAATDPTIDLSKWRETQGLGRSTAATLAEIAAVVGPWLAALGIPKLLTGA
jgi:hypothetical protein